MKKDIFLVDADDTLLDFHGASERAMKYAFSAMGIVWEETYMQRFRVLNAGLWESLERKELTRDELMANRFPLFMKSLGLNVDGKRFNEIYLEHLSTHPIYIDGAETFLQKLRGLGRVYIVTNGTEWIQRSRFTIANLWQYAEDTFISQTVGADKPAKAYTDYVISHIPDFALKRAVWIGDSLSADVKAANDAGIESIWFNPKKLPLSNKATPDYTVESFEQIFKIL